MVKLLLCSILLLKLLTSLDEPFLDISTHEVVALYDLPNAASRICKKNQLIVLLREVKHLLDLAQVPIVFIHEHLTQSMQPTVSLISQAHRRLSPILGLIMRLLLLRSSVVRGIAKDITCIVVHCTACSITFLVVVTTRTIRTILITLVLESK